MTALQFRITLCGPIPDGWRRLFEIAQLLSTLATLVFCTGHCHSYLPCHAFIVPVISSIALVDTLHL